MAEIFKQVIKRFFWVPFVLGMIGYFGLSHMGFWESIYASGALYFVNPVTDNSNIIILLAKITAVVVTTSVLIVILSSLAGAIDRFFARRYKDSTAVYSDTEEGMRLAKSLRHGYFAPGKKAEKTENHIIMYQDDLQNIRLYSGQKDAFSGKPVYILLNEIDPFLLEASGNVHFFNVFDLTARKYWRDQNLFEETENAEPVQIAIIGYEKVGQAIFRYAYLNNIYRLDQKIEYHVWGCDIVQKEFLKELQFENQDRVIVHEEDCRESLDLIAGMNRVILTKEPYIELLQEILYRNPDGKVHCWSPQPMELDRIYAGNAVVVFGMLDEILTEDQIKREAIYRKAKLFNYDYALRYGNRHVSGDYEVEMEKEWVALDGFKKGSNIARADHYWIEKRLSESGTDEHVLWELEHIRWCRFHYINHWKYDPVRDDAKRRHHLLIPYADLPQNEKEKDGIWDDVLKDEIEKLTQD